jgi:hypothetical protein
MTRSRFFTIPFLLAYVYIFIVGAVMLFAAASYRGAAQDLPENYFYFMQFYAKYSDPVAQKAFTPHTGCLHGHNIIFMDGCDGAAGLEKGIHFEPYKYVLSPFYHLVPHPLAISAIFILVFYAPILYAAFLARRYPRYAAVLLWAMLAYAFYPGSPFTAIIALRPMVFFYPFLTLFLWSVFFNRSKGEQFVFLNLLLATREDALLLAAIGIVCAFALELSRREKHGVSAFMVLNWLLWFGINLAYFKWVKNAFGFYIPASQSLKILLASHALVLGVLGLGAVLAGSGVLWYLYTRRAWRWAWVGTAAVVIVPLAFMTLLLVLGWSAFPWTEYFIYNRIGMLVCLATLLTLIGAVTIGPSTWKLGWWKVALPAAVAVFLVLDVVGHSSALSHYFQYEREARDASVLFHARSTISRTTGVVLDETTSQEFYDYDTAVVYNGFTYEPLSEGPVFHPNTPAELTDAFAHRISYIVVRNDTLPDLVPLVAAAGKKLVVTETNATYSFLAVR